MFPVSVSLVDVRGAYAVPSTALVTTASVSIIASSCLAFDVVIVQFCLSTRMKRPP